MRTANSVDEYITNLNRSYLVNIITNFISLLILAICVSYLMVKKGFPLSIYLIIAYPPGYLIWELYRRRKVIGVKIWNILCPKCNEYIPLHHFECPEPCRIEYKNKSIIEGCPKCKTRYKKAGLDAFRYAICDSCNDTLYFSKPYDFKSWSVLAKGETWETKTLLIKNDFFFNALGKRLFVVGLILIVFLKLDPRQPDSAIGLGIYFSVIGLIFIIIHKLLYGDIKRVPNPTFKRKEEPKEIYVPNDSLIWRLILLLGVVLFFAGSALIEIMIVHIFFIPKDLNTGELIIFTPFDIAWRISIFALAIILIVAHSIAVKEYKKVPNPQYKEGES